MEDPLVNQMLHFARVIAGKEQPIVSGTEGMKSLQVVEAVASLWVEQGGVAWNGLAELEWQPVAAVLNRVLAQPLTAGDLRELRQESASQVEGLKATVLLEKCS